MSFIDLQKKNKTNKIKVQPFNRKYLSTSSLFHATLYGNMQKKKDRYDENPIQKDKQNMKINEMKNIYGFFMDY